MRKGGKVAINLDHHNLPAPPTEMTNKNPFYTGDKQTAFPIFRIKGFHKLYFANAFLHAFAPYMCAISYSQQFLHFLACTFVSILEYSKE
jgi:hypothetical protein